MPDASKNTISGLANSGAALEGELRKIWAQYISCIDRDGPSAKATALRSRYFSLYRQYRNNKNWEKLVSGNQ